MHMSRESLNKLTKPWEEYVGYPYDDKRPKVHGKYPEWAGGSVRGTITIGYGHTNAAGNPRIVPGMKVTKEEAENILARDIAPCERDVERLVKVPLGQHQYDTLVDFVFNAGAGTLQKSTLLKKLNRRQYDAVPGELMKFTLSKGEHMAGLVHRRQAEIKVWTAPDHGDPDPSPDAFGVPEDDVLVPKADLPDERPVMDSKTIAATTTGAIAGVTGIAQAASDTLAPVKDLVGTANDLGIMDHIGHLISSPVFLGCVVLALGAFVIWDRWRKLRQETR